MKKLALDPNNPASIVASVSEFLRETQSVYQGMIDQVPEAFRTQVKSLKDKVDQALTSLASRPTEQVPAALDAASTLRHLTYMIDHMQEMIGGTMDALNKMVSEFSPKATTLQALQGRIEKKELVESSEVETRINQAKDETRKAERDRQKLLSTRRTVLAKADVPLPVDDSVLEGDEKAFEAFSAKASERTKKLRDLGQITVLNGEDLTNLIYGPDVQFNCVIKAIENASKGNTAADPMLGGRTPSDSKPKRLCIA